MPPLIAAILLNTLVLCAIMWLSVFIYMVLKNNADKK